VNAADPRVIVALDFPDMMSAFGLAARLDPALCAVKVGKELFTVAEAGLVRELVRRGFRVFLDLKFHDIPNTVAQACVAATRLGVWMIDVHAAGGGAMLAAARDAVARTAAEERRTRPLLIAIASWNLYEKHFLKLKRFFPRREIHITNMTIAEPRVDFSTGPSLNPGRPAPEKIL